MDAALRTRYVSEVRFLRALAYFNLVRAFGGVPLYTKPAVTPAELNIPRASRDDVYALISATWLRPPAPCPPATARPTWGA
ncbi:MAG: RagB/SusD family nutrient uptake outer membrane protein [Janthinobacterium lividum]